jgi:4-amino-4-deoxy-L-arabinose transferase-like glycosyltransferase
MIRLESRLQPKLAALPVALVIYLVLAISLAATKAPWCDEGWFANPSYNLAFRGHMGSNVLEPAGHFLNAYLSGIQTRTYIVTPNFLVGLAAWYKLVGFSLFTMRLYSILWGALGLVALYYIARRLLPDPRIARLAVLLCSIDFMLLWISADGRMEAMAGALALCSLASYLHFRESRYGWAMFASQVFGALAVFTHPNALIGLLTVPVLAVMFDRSRLRPVHACLAAIPYVLCATPWILYILQSPADFQAQFLANAAGRGSARYKIFFAPWKAVIDEFKRHVAIYLVSTLFVGRMNPWMVFIPFLYLPANVWLVSSWRRLGVTERMFAVCAVTVVLGLTFLNGFKAATYLEYVIPFYEVTFAAFLIHLYSKRGRDAKAGAVMLGVAFAVTQLATTYQHVRAREYQREYLPAVEEIERYRAEGRTIVGTTSLGFGLGFHGFQDDWRLGLYTGLRPDILVLDRSYRDFARRFEDEEPKVLTQYCRLLSSEYRLTSVHGAFWIFERRPPRAIDTSEVYLQEKRKKADYLFHLIIEGKYADPLRRSSL